MSWRLTSFYLPKFHRIPFLLPTRQDFIAPATATCRAFGVSFRLGLPLFNTPPDGPLIKRYQVQSTKMRAIS
ncbi:MAG: hypothetical protein ACYS67_09170 [Planctomycetota bacterium]